MIFQGPNFTRIQIHTRKLIFCACDISRVCSHVCSTDSFVYLRKCIRERIVRHSMGDVRRKCVCEEMNRLHSNTHLPERPCYVHMNANLHMRTVQRSCVARLCVRRLCVQRSCVQLLSYVRMNMRICVRIHPVRTHAHWPVRGDTRNAVPRGEYATRVRTRYTRIGVGNWQLAKQPSSAAGKKK